MVFTRKMLIIHICILTLVIFSAIAEDPGEDPGTGADLSQLEGVKVHLEEFGACEGAEDMPLRYEDVSLEMIGRNEVAVTGRYIAEKVVGENKAYKVEIEIIKCDSKQQVDSCQHFLSHEVDMCSHLPEKNKLWSALVNYTKGFIPDCPLKPGTFIVDKAPVNVGDMEKLPVCVGYWKIDAIGKDGGEPVTCIHAELRITAKRHGSVV